MPRLYGKSYTKSEILDRMGDIYQIGGTRLMKFVEGPYAGVDVVEFRTGTGFTFHCVPGRALDITIAEFCGKAMGWMSGSGEVSGAYYEPEGLAWLRNFPGGLVATCGLITAGAPSEDAGEQLGLHGRIGNTAATNLWVDGEWDGDEYIMWAAGKMREVRLFGENILLKRKVWAKLGENRFFIDDIVTNEGPRRTPHMILYHINGGWPAVDEGSLLVSPTKSATPRDVDAETDKEHYYRMDPPIAGFMERCYYHDMGTDADGFVYAALINKNLPDGGQFGFYVKYNKNELPRFTEWKMNGTREYVVGMEPANCWVEGRAKDRERGILQFLKPGETREYHLELGVLTNADDVAEFESKVASLKG